MNGIPTTDFSETAHLLGQLDLVVTVDTAVAYLAGALVGLLGCCCLRTQISAGCVNGLIHPGIPPCVYFDSNLTEIGSR